MAEVETGSSRWLGTPHRLYGLCDGVFAISMTLLALEVRVPDGVHHVDERLLARSVTTFTALVLRLLKRS